MDDEHRLVLESFVLHTHEQEVVLDIIQSHVLMVGDTIEHRLTYSGTVFGDHTGTEFPFLGHDMQRAG